MKTFNQVKKERDIRQIANDSTAPFTTAGAKAAAQSIAKKANPTITGSMTGTGAAVPAVPAVSQANKSGRTYDPNINYMQESMNAAAKGDLAGAMYNERMHNIKDGDMGLGWGASGMWNYLDSDGLGGRRSAKYDEIENYFRDGFTYDFADDPVYQQILGQKQKEADKAYKDGYAQLSTAFDGDIPVNMINKLLTTKSEIVDSADSYIPQLRQMAYDMYMDKGNQLYNQYGLLDAMADEDYDKFLADRDFRAQGVRDAYYNKTDAERYAEDVAYRDYRDGISDARYDNEWNYQLGRDAVEDERYMREWDYQLGRDAVEDERWKKNYELDRYRTYK